MNTIKREIELLAAHMSPKARLIVFVVTLALFVIGAGAPAAGGGFGG
jgi:hypothetical protein